MRKSKNYFDAEKQKQIKKRLTIEEFMIFSCEKQIKATNLVTERDKIHDIYANAREKKPCLNNSIIA